MDAEAVVEAVGGGLAVVDGSVLCIVGGGVKCVVYG